MKIRILFAALLIFAGFGAPALSPLENHEPFDSASLARAASVPNPPLQSAQAPGSLNPGFKLESTYTARETSGTLFENVAAVLANRYYDQRFRSDVLPSLVTQYAERARRATTLRDQRDLVEEFLSHIPASHLGLLSTLTHLYIMSDLQGRPYPTFGFQLIELKGKFYAFAVLEGGPGQVAGVLSWDRIVSIDDIPIEKSARVDWRSDDAYITDERDPPVHYLTCLKGDTINVKIERQTGKYQNLTVRSEEYSAFRAARASAHIFKTDGRALGYLHIWYVHLSGVPELLKLQIQGEFAKCDGLILDLRGRGGSGQAIQQILAVLREVSESKHWPIIALLDRQSRSAKDVMAYELKRTGLARLVGEPTAGAVIPASFADVGHDTVLMFPSFKLPRYTDLLEFKPVLPDVPVERAGPLSAGQDPILTAGIAEAVRLLKSQTK